MQALRDIFEKTLGTLNIVATPEQAENAFTVACREFFSYVTPLYEVPLIDGLTIGGEIINDELGLGIGKFRITSVTDILIGYMIGVKPIDYSDFKIDYGYMGAFQYVCEYMLKKVERDNYLMIKSAGIEEPETIDVENIAELRDYLKKEFSITPAGLI
ncbi:MAG: hypothetical protein ACWGHH_06520 [Sulfurovaceae bacterium]